MTSDNATLWHQDPSEDADARPTASPPCGHFHWAVTTASRSNSERSYIAREARTTLGPELARSQQAVSQRHGPRRACGSG